MIFGIYSAPDRVWSGTTSGGRRTHPLHPRQPSHPFNPTTATRSSSKRCSRTWTRADGHMWANVLCGGGAPSTWPR